ncbi:LysR substrate-binding domain-containing protein [Pontibacterium granulatum]|uniref:LysR substrate-binding domain-containing protein n=1 Tax=Pontibacterium granulatum TaxID=2036029 RepID=UPI00249A81A2|nr:LysR substrate-binding domain-containing protein [Pontibacterium granulatum]MDI3325207.1 LysR substrate-binding domain-containing protein [Pontibacterium granulatum]
MLHLPLLNALKTFVVAGHYLNFTKAAEELLVSPSAVSHQIRVLEDYLGLKLFLRQKRTLILTPEGKHLHSALEGPFDQIARAIQDVVQHRGRDSLNIALRPFFSSAWLAQRLSSFWGQHPDIQIDLMHTIKVPDFLADNIDLAIIWGKGNWPDLESELLIPGNLTPVCSTDLLHRVGPVESPQDLQKFTLIHDEDHSAWDDWLRKAGVTQLNTPTSLIIDDTNVRLQAVLNGQGVMLGCPALLKNEFSSGRLIQLFDTCLDTYSYHLAYPKSHKDTQRIATFVQWIKQTSESERYE